MRKWIEHLVSNGTAYGDFCDYTEGIQNRLLTDMKKAILAGNNEEARALASEHEVYNRLNQVVKRSLGERQAQLEAFSTQQVK